MRSEVLRVRGLSKRFGGITALDGFCCSISSGEILGLVGPNGSGKSTLFNVIGGFVAPDSGHVFIKGNDVTKLPPHSIANLGVARTFQLLRLARDLTVLDNVLLSFRQQPGERVSQIFFRWHRCKTFEANIREKAMHLLELAGLSDSGEEPAGGLSYGQQKLLSIACCFASGAELVLLDEPIAGIAMHRVDVILRLIHDLKRLGTSVMLIEHNLEAISPICDRMLFMNAGVSVLEGAPEQIRNDPEVVGAYLQ